MNHEKVICDNCDWHGTIKDLLSAANPFDSNQQIYACPNCKELSDTILLACDIEGCFEVVCAGSKLKSGEYINVCRGHIQELKK